MRHVVNTQLVGVVKEEGWRRGTRVTARLICGIDEAGRGPIAGPVTAAAVILPRDFPLEILDDSKVLSAAAAARRPRRSSATGGVLGARVGDARGDRRDQHPAGHAPRHDARRGRPCRPARTQLLVDGLLLPRVRHPGRPRSSRATPRCRRSWPPRSSPRPRGTPGWRRTRGRSLPTCSRSTRGTRRRSTGRIVLRARGRRAIQRRTFRVSAP